MKAFTLILISFLIALVLGASPCNIAYSNVTNVTTFEDCKAYITSSSDKFCCYVNGVDKNENPISACAELTGTVRGALKDLDELEGGIAAIKRYYYLKADCHLDKEISICHPDDKKSYSPLSADYCSKYSVVETVTGVDDKSKCCYVSGISVDKKNVYSCIGIDNNFYTIDERKNEIENGDFKRLGALTDIKIECSIANFYSISIISLLLSILFI